MAIPPPKKQMKQVQQAKRGFFFEVDWPRDCSSEFECESGTTNSTYSFDDASIISEDLNLYEDSKKALDEALTDEQIEMLDQGIEEFQVANYESREQIVKDNVAICKSTWPQHFNHHGERDIQTFIRQHLYSKAKPVTSGKTQTQMAEESQQITLTAEHMSLLERHFPKFRSANIKQQEKIVGEVADHIEKTWTNDVPFDRDSIIGLIREHLHSKRKRPLRNAAFGPLKWSYLDIVTVMHREEVHNLAVQLAEDKGGSSLYIGNYKRARAEFSETLTESQRERYMAMAKEWTEKGLPVDMKQRMMRKNGTRVIKDFTSAVWRQFGMRVVVLAAFVDDEDPSMSLFDYNRENGGTSFKARHKNWETYPMMEDFAVWGAQSFGVSPTDDGAGGSGKKKECPEIKLKRDKDGYPILPSAEEVDGHDLLCRKRLIGRFMGDIYGMSTGKGKGRIPWAELQKAQGDYVEGEYLPENVVLRQYYHLRQDDVNALLGHWTQRQSDGKIPFRFKKVAKASRQNQCASEESDADTDMELGEESEEGPQDDNRSQAQADELLRGGDGSSGSTEQAHPGQTLGNAAENPNGPSRCSPDNEATQPSTASAQQQMGGGAAPDSPHSRLPPTHSPHHTLNRPLPDGSQTGQTEGPNTEGGQSGPGGSAGKRPSSNDGMQSTGEEHQPSPLRSPSTANEDQRPPPGTPDATHENPRPRPRPRPLARPRPASGNPPDEPPHSPQAPGSASLEMQGGGRLRCRTDEGAAADAPSKKRRKAVLQVDSAGFTTRRSNRDRRPTRKAAEK